MKGIIAALLIIAASVAGFSQARPLIKKTGPRKKVIRPPDWSDADKYIEEQSETPAVDTKWIYIATTTTGAKVSYRGRHYLRTFGDRQADVETWVKMTDPKPTYQKAFKAVVGAYAYSTTFHCEDRRYSINDILFYDRSGERLTSRFDYLGDLYSRVYRKPIPPDSPIEGLFNFFC